MADRRYNFLRGDYREMCFTMRLFEKGHVLVFRPSFRDVGVDCAVFTSKGWRGVQIKSIESDRSSRGRAVSKKRRPERFRISLGGRSAEYYRAAGVHVIAAAHPDGFFLVPIAEAVADRKRWRISREHWTWEAWDAVLGEPVKPPSWPSVCPQDAESFAAPTIPFPNTPLASQGFLGGLKGGA